MSKKVIVLFVVCALIAGFISRVSFAEEKIALVSLQRALNDVNEGKKAKEMLKSDFDAKKKKIDVMKADLEKMYAELDKQKSVLSQEALGAKIKDFQAKRDDLQSQGIAFEKEFRAKEMESTNKIMTALRTLVTGLAKKEGYTLLIENSAETVLFSANGTDITDKLIAAYNSGAK